MDFYLILVALICLSSAFAYVNHRFLKMPFVIGLFFLATVLSLVIISTRWWDFRHYSQIRDVISGVELSDVILNIMLGFLLFAGALHTNWAQIKNQLKPILLFALPGVLVSTVIISTMLFWITNLLEIQVSWLHCLIFGALISPTDPIAVLGILTKANVSKKVESTIVGESLFNDGIGVVIFIALLETLKAGSTEVDFLHFGGLFLQEAIGGLLFGLALGYILHYLLKSIDNYETEVLLTVAFVMGGYAASNMLHMSGALAMVVMGLFVGNYKQKKSMSDLTQEYVHKFWELTDVILNAILFISIAFILVVIDFRIEYFVVGVLSVVAVLLSRIIVIFIPKQAFPRTINLSSDEAKVMVWGGLRGGLSIALVLSIPESDAKPILIIATYCCVVFSILVQGLTVGKMARYLMRKKEKGTT